MEKKMQHTIATYLKREEYNELNQYMKNVNEFKTELSDLSKTWDQLILLSQLGSTNINMSETKKDFTLPYGTCCVILNLVLLFRIAGFVLCRVAPCHAIPAIAPR